MRVAAGPASAGAGRFLFESKSKLSNKLQRVQVILQGLCGEFTLRVPVIAAIDF